MLVCLLQALHCPYCQCIHWGKPSRVVKAQEKLFLVFLVYAKIVLILIGHSKKDYSSACLWVCTEMFSFHLNSVIIIIIEKATLKHSTFCKFTIYILKSVRWVLFLEPQTLQVMMFWPPQDWTGGIKDKSVGWKFGAQRVHHSCPCQPTVFSWVKREPQWVSNR